MTNWKPIKTAPPNKDVLVYWPQREYDDDMPTGKVVGGIILVTVKQGDYWLEPEVMAACGHAFDDDFEYAAEPSHWMPLPKAPEVI